MYFPRWANRALITWFGCGLVPVAPGTAGSIGALPLCWAMATYAPLWARIVFATGMTAIAILGSAQDQIELAKSGSEARDPQYIVVDEVAGMLWTTLFATPTVYALGAGFVLFRIFDVLKPLPANLFDRASKTSPSAFRRGAHIVLDDVIAGIYGMLVLALLYWLSQRFGFTGPTLLAPF